MTSQITPKNKLKALKLSRTDLIKEIKNLKTELNPAQYPPINNTRKWELIRTIRKKDRELEKLNYEIQTSINRKYFLF